MRSEIKSSPGYQRLKKIFEDQVMALERLVTDTESAHQISFLRDSFLKRHVIETALILGLQDTEIPILAVIPRNCMETMRQLSFIRFHGFCGMAELNLNKIKDIDKDIPHHHPYWAFGIDTGVHTLGMTARQASIKITEMKMRTLTLSEIIALHIHYPLLELFSTHAPSSSYRTPENDQVENVAGICISYGKPVATWNSLDRNKIGEGIKPWVTPSCIRRMGNLGIMTYIQRRPWRKRRERK